MAWFRDVQTLAYISQLFWMIKITAILDEITVN